jgi:deoxyribonuclease I
VSPDKLRRAWLTELARFVPVPPLRGGRVSAAASELLSSLHPPTSDEITRYLTLTGRPNAVTLPAIVPDVEVPRRIPIELWNFRDLFDAHNDRSRNDLVVDKEAYLARLQQIAATVRATNDGKGPLILGCAGIERLQVLTDLAGAEGPLADLGYTIIHVDGPEESGLDDAILTKLPVIGQPSLHVLQGLPQAARGILEATVDLGTAPLTILMVHAKSEEAHVDTVLRRVIYDRLSKDPNAAIAIMRDDTIRLLDNENFSMSATAVAELEPRVSVELEHVKRSRNRRPAPDGAMVAPGVWISTPPAPGLPYVSVHTEIGDPVRPHDPAWYRGLSGAALLDAMRARQPRPAVLSYYDARDYLFRDLFNQGGWVQCVYTGRRIQTEGIPLATVMNTEHTYPISEGIENTIQVTDLHHLFPCDPFANSKRATNPYGVVAQVQWEDVSKLGLDAASNLVFEPPDSHKGTVARAMAYVALCGAKVPELSIAALRDWNTRFPPDDAERRRNDLIALVQGNRNPFIDDPDLVDRIWS